MLSENDEPDTEILSPPGPPVFAGRARVTTARDRVGDLDDAAAVMVWPPTPAAHTPVRLSPVVLLGRCVIMVVLAIPGLFAVALMMALATR